jgi:pilus assembly protein TadC
MTSRLWHLGAVGAGLAMVVLFGWRYGPVVGLLTTAVAEYALRRRVPEARARELRRVAVDLPIAADLLGAALLAGTPPETAARVVGTAIGGALGERLVSCADELRQGATVGQAWRSVADLPGGERLVRAAVRSADSGAALTGALTRVADDLRAARDVAAEARARRVGVFAVLPLGLCFLPAFVLTGVVPVVVAVLGDVLQSR